MASVSVDDVRDVINVSSAEVPDVKVLKMVKRAEVTFGLETGKEIDYSNYTNDQNATQQTTLTVFTFPAYLAPKRRD